MNPLLLAVIGVGLVGTLPDLWRGLRDASAPRAAFAIAVVVYGAVPLVAAGVLIGWIPGIAVIVSAALALALLLTGHLWLIRVTGGPVDKRHLAAAYTEIVGSAKQGSTLTKPEFDRLRRKILTLDRFRNSETDEFVTLAKVELLDWADGREASAEEARARSRRMQELSDRLWPPLAHDIRER